METFLCKQPWVPYLDNFFQSYLVLKYPKNIIFTAQVLAHFLKGAQKIYDTYPHAQKFDVSSLDSVDWKNTVVTIDKHSEFLVAPEPLQELVNLDKRLNYKKAERILFPSFSFIYRYGFVVLVMLVAYAIQLFRKYDLLYHFRYM